MKECKILIISDLHCGEQSESKEFGKDGHGVSFDDARRIAISISDCLKSNCCSPDYLFIAGDLTSKGSPGEFESCSLIISALQEECGISYDNTVVAFGNHDIDWGIYKMSNSCQPHDRSGYVKLCSKIGALFTKRVVPTINGNIDGSGVYKYDGLNIIVLNSGIESYPDNDLPCGSLTKTQLEWFKSVLHSGISPDELNILLIHHHIVPLPYPTFAVDISELAEGKDILDLLAEKEINIVVHGHRHHPALKTIMHEGWKKPISILCAGSLSVNSTQRSEGYIPNVFHYMSVMQDGCGYVSTFRKLPRELTWKTINTDYESIKMDPTQWFGDISTHAEIDEIISEMYSKLHFTENKASVPLYIDLPLQLKCIRRDHLLSRLNAIAKNNGMLLSGNPLHEHAILIRPAR